MLLLRKDGTLEHFIGEKVETLNASTTESAHTLENGAVIRMICHWGEKRLVPDRDAIRRALAESPGSQLMPSYSFHES